MALVMPSQVAFPFSGDLPHPGMEPRSPALQADSSPAEPPGKPVEIPKGSARTAQRSPGSGFGG